MRLPIAVQGALMPDAHAGYGLPIGGVLAVKDAVIPYAVGVDIGCRMTLSVFAEKPAFIQRYAQCHERIHINLAKALGLKAIATIGNHHNFAWKELSVNGNEIVIHRKGATPAHSGEAGIIPGSMANPGYLVCGKGNKESLDSASHGAGRAMSREKAKENFTQSALKKMLSAAGVSLIGGSVEEVPLAYKNIERVMDFQKELVDIHGQFMPKIVRMNKE